MVGHDRRGVRALLYLIIQQVRRLVLLLGVQRLLRMFLLDAGIAWSLILALLES